MQEPQSNENEIMNVKAAARHVKLARPLFTRALRRGRLKAARAGDRGDYRIVFGDLMRWVGEGMPGLESWTADEAAIIAVETRARRVTDRHTLATCDDALRGDAEAKAKVLAEKGGAT